MAYHHEEEELYSRPEQETLTTTTTEVDPDGPDRGGYHQVSHVLGVRGECLVYRLEASDRFQERLGELPEPVVSSKESAVLWVEQLIAAHEQAAQNLWGFVEKIKATVMFQSEVPKSGDDDDEDDDGDEHWEGCDYPVVS